MACVRDFSFYQSSLNMSIYDAFSNIKMKHKSYWDHQQGLMSKGRYFI